MFTRHFLPLLSLTLLLACTGKAYPDSLLIRDVYIVSPGREETNDRYQVLMENGRISAIGKKRLNADHVIDGSGRFLIPGLIDSHVHLDSIPGYQPSSAADDSILVSQAKAQIPRSYLYFGFTTVVDLAARAEFIDQWNRQKIAPQALFCIPLVIPNGYPLAWRPADQQFTADTTPYMLYDARQSGIIPASFKPEEHSPAVLVKRAKADGASCIKMFYETGFGRLKNLPVPTREMVDEVVAVAHKENLPVVLHGNSETAYRFALETGVDILAHGMWHWGELATANETKREKFFQRIIQSGKKVQPTIQVIYGEQELFNPEFFSQPEVARTMPRSLIEWYRSGAGQWMKKNMGAQFGENQSEPDLYEKVIAAYQKPISQLNQLTRALASSRNTLIFGSDTPSGPFYTQFPGLNGYREIQRWNEAGVDPVTLFNALTINNARTFGIDNKLGSVEVGKIANLLLLKENPLHTINAYDSIDTVILKGVEIKRNSLAAPEQ